MKNRAVLLALLMGTVALQGVFAQAIDLSIGPQDTRIEIAENGGYYLYVRQKPGVGSVLITESTEDPERRVATYALRNPNFHPENGEELRRLNGEFIDPQGSLMDSTPMDDEQLGTAFRIYLPYIVQYGYDWTRNGTIQLIDGSYISIRTFELPYSDYDGAFLDNPFLLRIVQREREPVPEPEEIVDDSFSTDTVETYTSLSNLTEGESRFSSGEADVIDQIDSLLEPFPEGSVDIVLVLDTTQSMNNDLPALKEELVPLLREKAGDRSDVRVGITLYRDYLEEYMYRTLDMTSDWGQVQRAISSARAFGGRDTPEAVHEALYAALTRYQWEADTRLMILIGDAPPHPMARGNISETMVAQKAGELGIEISVIILPQ